MRRFRNYRIRALLYAGQPNWDHLDRLTPPRNPKSLLTGVPALGEGERDANALADRLCPDGLQDLGGSRQLAVGRRRCQVRNTQRVRSPTDSAWPRVISSPLLMKVIGGW